MDGTTEGAARQRGCSVLRRKPTGERYREALLSAPQPRKRTARILPYYVSTELPEDILSHEETLAELKARGLSIELIQYLRKAPTRLDDDEEEDPWGLRKKGVTLDMKPEAEQRSLAEAAKRGERVSAITARSARDTSDGTEEIELGKVIARLRRDQPRNADTMRICDALEHRLKPHRTAAAPA